MLRRALPCLPLPGAKTLFYLCTCAAMLGMWAQPSALPAPALLIPDKIWHVGVYGALTVLALRAHPHAVLWRVAIGVFLFSLGVELGQGVAGTGRALDVLDALANLTGVALGALVCTLAFQRKPGHPRLKAPPEATSIEHAQF